MNRIGVAGATAALTIALHAAIAGGLLSAERSAAAASSGDRSVAETILSELERTAPRSEVTAEPVAKARSALDRAARMRASGDEAHALLADGLARDWAEVARDLVATVALEEKAAAARREALDGGANAERERALLEEATARVGRVKAQLEDAEREKRSPEAANVTSTAASDAGAKGLRRGASPAASAASTASPSPRGDAGARPAGDARGETDGGSP